MGEGGRGGKEREEGRGRKGEGGREREEGRGREGVEGGRTKCNNNVYWTR